MIFRFTCELTLMKPIQKMVFTLIFAVLLKNFSHLSNLRVGHIAMQCYFWRFCRDEMHPRWPRKLIINSTKAIPLLACILWSIAADICNVPVTCIFTKLMAFKINNPHCDQVLELQYLTRLYLLVTKTQNNCCSLISQACITVVYCCDIKLEKCAMLCFYSNCICDKHFEYTRIQTNDYFIQ